MPERAYVYALTGDDVVRFALEATRPGDPEALLRGVGARCVAVDPHDPRRLYVGTLDRGVYASEDGGRSWRNDEGALEDRRVLSVAVSHSHSHAGISVAYAGTEPSDLYRSDDGGETWLLLPALREVPSRPRWSFPPRPWTHHVRTIALHPTDPDSLAVGIELGGVIRSRDGGVSWIDHDPQAYSDAHELATHPLAPERLYEAAGQGVARSEDRGATWSKLEDGLDRHYAWAQAIDPADPDLWYAAVSRSPFAAHGDGDGQAHLWRSRGNGWVAVDHWGDSAPLRRMPYALTALPDRPGSLLVGLRGGTLVLTDDAAETWTRLPLELDDIIAFAVAPA